MQTNNKIDDLIRKQEENKEKQRQELENLKMASKELFSDVNGKYFLKYLKQICLWSEQDININAELLIYKKGRRDIWTIVRNVIPKDVLALIEIYDETNE